jgi:hypothetical protein
MRRTTSNSDKPDASRYTGSSKSGVGIDLNQSSNFKKQEYAKRLADLDEGKTELTPSTIGLINKVRYLLILWLFCKFGWHILHKVGPLIESRIKKYQIAS